MSGSLSGITVVDLSRILAGPYCTMMLGDLGAEVLKVEPPQGDDSRGWGPPFSGGESAYFLAVNRNKRSLRLNLKTDGGSEVLKRLLRDADVLVENFRPGALARLGFGYEAIRDEYPRLVYCSISGYGHTGPLSEKPGFDVVMQAEAGWMHLTGEPDGPPLKVGASLADVFTGMMAAQGITSALYGRQRTGRGRKVDVALFDSVLATLCYQAQGYLMTGDEPQRIGNRHPSLAPYETFETSDGHVILGVGNDKLWQRFIAAVERPDLDQERFATNAGRVENHGALKELLDALFAGDSTDGWIEQLEAAGIPAGRIRNVGEVFANPQVAARNMRLEVDHPSVGTLALTGNPIKFADGEERSPLPPPRLGEHTEEILREKLGLDDERIEELRAEGAI